MAAAEVASNLGRTYAAVKTRAHTLGITSKARVGTASIRHDYFHQIDTPEKAYVLGLIAADGNVRSDNGRLQLKLEVKDRSAVELVRDQVAPDAPLREELTNLGNTMIVFAVQSPAIAQGLALHGVIPNKSHAMSWPNLVPKHLEGSYICGYFDGDGSLQSVKYPRWTIVSGTITFLERIQNVIEIHTGVHVGGPYTQKGQRVWSIVKSGKAVRELDEWIHRDVPGLPRKRLPDL